jgi:hypothetical protein
MMRVLIVMTCVTVGFLGVTACHSPDLAQGGSVVNFHVTADSLTKAVTGHDNHARACRAELAAGAVITDMGRESADEARRLMRLRVQKGSSGDMGDPKMSELDVATGILHYVVVSGETHTCQLFLDPSDTHALFVWAPPKDAGFVPA